MLSRFTGSCEQLAAVNVADVVAWICAIPLAAWPQQHRLHDGIIRPAMVSDLNWHGFGKITSPLIGDILSRCFPGACSYQPMLSVVMPGHAIDPHIDAQAPYWLCRVHAPLTTNSQSKFIVGCMHHHMQIGRAYRVNTEAIHSVENDGETPRIHFMFDVRS